LRSPVWAPSPSPPRSAHKSAKRRKKDPHPSDSDEENKESKKRGRDEKEKGKESKKRGRDEKEKEKRGRREDSSSSDDSDDDDDTSSSDSSEEERRRKKKKRKSSHHKRSSKKSHRKRARSSSPSSSPSSASSSSSEDEKERKKKKKRSTKSKKKRQESGKKGDKQDLSSSSDEEGEYVEKPTVETDGHAEDQSTEMARVGGQVGSEDEAAAPDQAVGDEQDDWAERKVDAPVHVGPVPLPKVELGHGGYGGAMMPGEAEAYAKYVQENKRIPRRGEVGLTSEEIEKFETLGYVMSGSRHKRMNAVRIRKENQVYSAEEKRALALFNYEEKAKRENKILAEFREMIAQKFGTINPGSGGSVDGD